MTVEFIETPKFAANREELFGSDDGFRRFQTSLIENPRSGPAIPGTGGIRKVRWCDPKRQKGKRGGLRVIYLYVEEAETVLLLVAYDKDAVTDLTPSEKRIWAAAADAYKRELTGRKENLNGKQSR